MTLEESEIIELKKSTSELKEAINSIVAILNKHGHGELYSGIKNDGTVVGQDVTENVPENVPEKRNEFILINMKKNKAITITELSKLLNINEKTVKRDIEKLKQRKILKRVGPDKGGHWQVSDKLIKKKTSKKRGGVSV